MPHHTFLNVHPLKGKERKAEGRAIVLFSVASCLMFSLQVLSK